MIRLMNGLAAVLQVIAEVIEGWASKPQRCPVCKKSPWTREPCYGLKGNPRNADDQ